MQLVQNEPAMEQAWGVIKHLSADERERAEAEAVEKARRDLVSRLRSAEIKGHAAGLAEGEAKGRAEGKAEGRAEGEAKGRAEGEAARTREVAQNLLHLGLPIAQIAAATGLSATEIEALRTVQ